MWLYYVVLIIIIIIVDARVSGNGFLSLDEGRLERLGVSLGFLLPLVNIIQELVCSRLVRSKVQLLWLLILPNAEKEP